jgi:hypothetical protein
MSTSMFTTHMPGTNVYAQKRTLRAEGPWRHAWIRGKGASEHAPSLIFGL